MSQAHYVRCGHMAPAFNVGLEYAHHVQCVDAAVVVMHMPYVLGNRFTMCVRHMIEFFDRMDALGEHDPSRHSEPTKIEWVWDAGTRECVLHQWPAVLCEGWTEEHRALRRRGLFGCPTAEGA